MEKEIELVLESEEKVLWQDVMNRKVIIFNFLLSLGLILAFFAYFMTGKISFEISSGLNSKLPYYILLAVVLLTVWGLVASYVTRYVITNKRVLIKSGIIGTDFNSVYFTEIKSANVNVGLIDKIFGVGSINIDTGKLETVTSGTGEHQRTSVRTAYDRLQHINNPYEIYKILQESLTERQESLFSGRADKENNPDYYVDTKNL